jgi:hypothetical protein
VLIDCDTCTVRGQGCDDCVVTVLLGAPPGWRGSDPTVVPLTRRAPEEGTGGRRPAAARTGPVPGRCRTDGGGAETARDAPEPEGAGCDVARLDTEADGAQSVVELDEVERRAVRALADFGLVPPLRHQDASTPGDRHVS